MKIKLFYSPRFYLEEGKFGYQREPPFIPPIGLCTLTSFLKKHQYSVEQDDLDIKVFQNNQKSKSDSQKINMSLFDDRERIAQFIKKGDDSQLEEEAHQILKKTKIGNKDIIGFSICDDHNFSTIGSTIVLSKIIKENTGARIIIGGVRHQRKIYEETLTDLDYIDFVVLHNHITALNLVKIIEKGGDLSKLQKISYNQNALHRYLKQAKNRQKWKLFDSIKGDDMIPPPAFEGLPLDLYSPSFTDYRSKGIKSKKKVLLLPFSFVIGCLEGCAFCPNTEKPGLILRNPKTVANELKALSIKYKTEFFLFLNTNVNPSYRYAEMLADELIRIDANIMWSDCANLKHLDQKLLSKLRRAGAFRLVYGMESASPKMLKYIEKGLTQTHAEKMLQASNKEGIWNELELIAGMPRERQEDVQITIDFIKRNKPYINYFYLAKYMLMNSKISLNPTKFGIENIRENIKNLKGIQQFNRRFDEINGLRWPEKVKQIEQSYKSHCQAISDENSDRVWNNQRGYDSQGETLHLLYLLYSIFKNKKEVVDYFRQLD